MADKIEKVEAPEEDTNLKGDAPKKKGGKRKPRKKAKAEAKAEPVAEVLEAEEPNQSNTIIPGRNISEEKVMEQIMANERERAKLNEQLMIVKREKNIEIIKGIQCVECGKPLPVEPEMFMVQGLTSEIVTCDNCKMVNVVQVHFEGMPEMVDPIIEVSRKGFDCVVTNPKDMTKEQVIDRIKYEKALIEADGRYKADPLVQVLIKAVDILL